MNKNKHILSRKFWISALISFIFILFIIPLFFTFSKDHKIVLPEGKFIKKGNRIFYNTLENLKNKNGFLVLGTSETGNGLNGQNYYHLLNKDKTINKPFLTLGGAGRCINMYFPYILDNKNVFKCLKVIYYINPTYWREGLNNYNQEYFERYVDCNLLMNSVKYDENFAKIKNFVSPPLKERTHLESLLDKFTDNFRSYYYYDLKKALLSNPDLTIKKSHSVENYYSKVELNSIKEEINQEFNVTLDFLKTKSSFPKIDKKSNYQTNQLNTFIELCKLYNIDPIFYIGPYNKIYCSKTNPELIPDYDDVINQLKQNLSLKNMNYIDGSEISTIPGTFLDVQHISTYGAYLTALQIKRHIIKHEN